MQHSISCESEILGLVVAQDDVKDGVDIGNVDFPVVVDITNLVLVIGEDHTDDRVD